MDFHANDVGYVPKMAGHYIENTGAEDLVFLEMFAASEFQEVSLNQWLRALPVQVAMAHTGLSAEGAGEDSGAGGRNCGVRFVGDCARVMEGGTQGFAEVTRRLAERVERRRMGA